MPDEPSESDPSEQMADEDTARVRIEPNSESAEYELLAIVAELGDTDIESLPSFYEQAGHFVEMIFQNPPAPEAQMEISFSYAGYRIRITQLGQVTILKVKESIEGC